MWYWPQSFGQCETRDWCNWKNYDLARQICYFDHKIPSTVRRSLNLLRHFTTLWNNVLFPLSEILTLRSKTSIQLTKFLTSSHKFVINAIYSSSTVWQNGNSPHKFFDTVIQNCRSPLKFFDFVRQTFEASHKKFATSRQKCDSGNNFFYNWHEKLVHLTDTSSPSEEIVILVAEVVALRYKTLVQLTNILTQLDKLVILATKFSALWDKNLTQLGKRSTLWNFVLLSLSELLTLRNNTSIQLTKVLTSWDKNCDYRHTFFEHCVTKL